MDNLYRNLLRWEGNIKYAEFSSDVWYSIPNQDHELFKFLIYQIKNKVKYVNDFEVYVAGGLLEDWDSWDIDMFMIGEYEPDKIKEVMRQIISIGFELNIFIDLSYITSLWRVDLMKKGFYNNIQLEVYKYHDTFERLGEVHKYKYEPIDGIFKSTHNLPYPKHIEKIENGYRYKKPIRII